MDPKEEIPKTGLFKDSDTVHNSDVHTRLHELVGGNVKPEEMASLKEFFPEGEVTTKSGMHAKLEELHWKNETLKREAQYKESHQLEKTIEHLKAMLGNH